MTDIISVDWFDDYNPESWRLCEKEYGVGLQEIGPADEGEGVKLEVSGPVGNVERFLADFEDGEPEPLSRLQREIEDDDEYKAEVERLLGELERK